MDDHRYDRVELIYNDQVIDPIVKANPVIVTRVTREGAEFLLNSHEKDWIGKLGVLQHEDMIERYQKTMQSLRDKGIEIGVIMKERPKTNDGKLNSWQMDQAVEDSKRNHENTVEIPVITTVEPKHEPKHKKK